MLRTIVERLVGRRHTASRIPGNGWGPATEAAPGSRRHLARAAGTEWRAHCTSLPRAAASLDGGLDRTAVRVWRDGARTVQSMGR
jgi:hypothetical protein